MPRPTASVPKYGFHRASGQAVCYVNRRPVYLGPFNSADSRERYAAVLAGLQRGELAERAKSPTTTLQAFTVNELCLRFLTDYAQRYRNPDGKSSAEVDCHKGAIRHLRAICGETLTGQFRSFAAPGRPGSNGRNRLVARVHQFPGGAHPVDLPCRRVLGNGQTRDAGGT